MLSKKVHKCVWSLGVIIRLIKCLKMLVKYKGLEKLERKI